MRVLAQLEVMHFDETVRNGTQWAWWREALKGPDGWWLTIEDPETGEDFTRRITPQVVANALALLMLDTEINRSVAASVVRGEADRCEADQFLQLAVLGEIAFA